MTKVIDMKAMIKSVENNPKYEVLVNIFYQAELVQGCGADVLQAAACLRSLDELEATIKDILPHHKTLQQALINSAIILYARGTHPGAESGGRGAVKTKKLLPNELRPLHDAIIEVRNKAVAHVHLGNGLDAWHQTFAVMAPTGNAGGWQPAMVTRAHIYNRDVIDKLRILIPAVEAIFQERYQDFLRQAAKLFNENPLDATAYVTKAEQLFSCDTETANKFLAGQGSGTTSTIYS
ncbi:hypothetical protein C8J46_11127 [Sphingomonas sp. PP-F2F-A104-K0414]|uniref:hypothetical protein n=1 Tax=Sphingomonas sp. PP-F2F-A104-K0414 TaxID=2135661 RepID=UPI00104E8CC5|nr:hypothetical protein [Sphingomonas sp. PP-F2F-A104-K0414]TCP95872.1 hypothetical protein C8J46_11127 [Sphingomonas sp. PP-F2F-A104-K0414]